MMKYILTLVTFVALISTGMAYSEVTAQALRSSLDDAGIVGLVQPRADYSGYTVTLSNGDMGSVAYALGAVSVAMVTDGMSTGTSAIGYPTSGSTGSVVIISTMDAVTIVAYVNAGNQEGLAQYLLTLLGNSQQVNF